MLDRIDWEWGSVYALFCMLLVLCYFLYVEVKSVKKAAQLRHIQPLDTVVEETRESERVVRKDVNLHRSTHQS
ncbi:hypothetical protein DIPPA_00775 [Diplonema papillatum]|nr:hypothetical protein DIPPA_00775 [Diplonema papillatum]